MLYTGSPITYERSVYAATNGFDLGLNVDLTEIGLNVDGECERGAEAVVERGAVVGVAHYPTESYPAITTNYFPSVTWPDLLSQWEINAAPVIFDAFKQLITRVQSGGNTIISTGQADLNILAGDLASGAQVVSSWAPHLTTGSGNTSLLSFRPLASESGTQGVYLPPDGASNYVYGIGGIYRFASTNTFNGTAILSITYSNADVVGLDPTSLQIYWLPDGSNHWQLVGGTVNTVSNTVTATITNLGTFAVAPPLLTGNLQLIPSTNALPADGVTQMSVVVSNLMLNTGAVATQQWLFTATATGVQLLNANADTNIPGVQVVSSNGTVTLLLQAPTGGTVAKVNLASVAGGASGSVEINLIDTTPPATPTGVSVSPGQSRIWVSWAANTNRTLPLPVYYQAGQNGPPYDGTASVEGMPSPVQVSSTNVLLRGLTLGSNYFVAVSALDTTGNESPLSSAIEVSTIISPPTPPTSVAARFGQDGTNIIMWALSEDDGYNDRDVVRYDIYRAVMPYGSYSKVGQVPAGVGVYSEPTVSLSPSQYLQYSVESVAAVGAVTNYSKMLLAFNVPVGPGVDSVGDGIPDSWRQQYFGGSGTTTNNHSCATCDADGTGQNNLFKYVAGLNPTNPASIFILQIVNVAGQPAQKNLIFSPMVIGPTYTLQFTTELVSSAWSPLMGLAGPLTNGNQVTTTDLNAVQSKKFYRVDISLTTNQSPLICNFAIDPNVANFGSSGGVSNVTVACPTSNCVWMAASSTNWITINSGSNGTGNGTVNYAVAVNSNTTARSGSLAIAGRLSPLRRIQVTVWATEFQIGGGRNTLAGAAPTPTAFPALLVMQTAPARTTC